MKQVVHLLVSGLNSFLANCDIFSMKFRMIVYKHDAENDQDALSNLFRLTDAKPSNTNDCFTCVGDRKNGIHFPQYHSILNHFMQFYSATLLLIFRGEIVL